MNEKCFFVFGQKVWDGCGMVRMKVLFGINCSYICCIMVRVVVRLR